MAHTDLGAHLGGSMKVYSTGTLGPGCVNPGPAVTGGTRRPCSSAGGPGCFPLSHTISWPGPEKCLIGKGFK